MKSYENELLRSRPSPILSNDNGKISSRYRYDDFSKCPFNKKSQNRVDTVLWGEYLASQSSNKIENAKDDHMEKTLNLSMKSNGISNVTQSSQIEYEEDTCLYENEDLDMKETILNATISENCDKSRSNKGSLYSKQSSTSLGSKRSVPLFDGDSCNYMADTMDTAPFIEDPSKANINFVIFLGMTLGMFLTKSFCWMDVYLTWLQKQILKMADVFLQGKTPGDFFNFDDNKCLSMRSKLAVTPLLALLALCYGLIYGLQCLFKFLLAPTPDWLLTLIEKDYL